MAANRRVETQAFSVLSKNAFEGLADSVDSDEEGVPKVAAKSSPINASAKTGAARGGRPQQSRRPDAVDNTTRAVKPPPVVKRDGAPANAIVGSDEEPKEVNRGPGRNWQNDRARGRGRGAAGSTRRRDFDRHVSGTGSRGRGLKKGGGGAHNWGNRPQDFGGDGERREEGWTTMAGATPTAQITPHPVVATPVSTGWGEAFAADDTAPVDTEEKAPPPKPKEPEAIDYEAYLRQQALKRANLPTLQPVTADNTTAQDLEKQGYTLHVKQDAEKPEAPSMGTASVGRRNRAAVDHSLEAELFQNRSTRGGRGRGRGRFEGNDRFDNNREDTRKSNVGPVRTNIDLKDTQAFPSLGE